MRNKNKLGQEEMVGFALILIIVAIIMLVFLGFSLRSPEKETVESYEVESFIQSFLLYTTECENNIEKLPIQKLIFSCYAKEQCLDGKDSCEVLETEMNNILEKSWIINEDSPVKGYELSIETERNESILDLRKGNITANSKGDSQPLPRSGILINVRFKAFY